MTLALDIQALKKTYASGTQALKGIDLEVKQGDFFALLGPNGAGKSTTIGIISSLVRKTSGKVAIMGVDIDKDAAKARRQMGVVAQEFNLPIFDRVIDIIMQQAGFYGVPVRIAKPRAEKILKQLGLWEKRKAVVRALSGGMKRRVMIAAAMIHEPKLLILDEPTAGVDIELRRGLYEYLEEQNKNGLTIILTTHYLEEAERLCNQIAIINHGEVVMNIPKRELSQRVCQQRYVLDVAGDLSQALPAGVSLRDEHCLEAVVSKGESLNDLVAALSAKNITVESIAPTENRLEQVFLELTAQGGSSNVQ